MVEAEVCPQVRQWDRSEENLCSVPNSTVFPVLHSYTVTGVTQLFLCLEPSVFLNCQLWDKSYQQELLRYCTALKSVCMWSMECCFYIICLRLFFKNRFQCGLHQNIKISRLLQTHVQCLSSCTLGNTGPVLKTVFFPSSENRVVAVQGSRPPYYKALDSCES